MVFTPSRRDEISEIRYFMKIFFSDLHLSDGKERDDFQFHKEFDLVVKEWSEEIKKVEVVLLGDIFDLIRTQKYYEFEGMPRAEIKLKVMTDITDQHAPFFETLRSFIGEPDHIVRYIIGNHDFATLLDPRLLQLIRVKYGFSLTPETHYRNEELEIWAEHGHRYNTIDNTFNKDGTPIEYFLGDRIVVEIVDKFYQEVKQRQDELGIDPTIINDLDNVRPQSAIPNWLDSIDEEGRLKQMYYDTITSFVVNNPGEVATLTWDLLTGKYRPDLLKAARDLARKDVGKYIIFGHTHDALDKKLAKGARYLNTGTWRKFIEPKGRPSTRMRTVPTYTEGGTQFYAQEAYFYRKFKTTINLSHVLFYEEGEGEVGPILIQEEKQPPNP